MKFKGYILILNILIMLIFTGCSNVNAQDYNSNIDVRGLTLKISLIETAYEMYNVNIGNPETFSDNLYNDYGKESYKHYKWLTNSYNDMDDEMKKSLKNIFTYRSNWDYIYSVINLDDNSTTEEIIKAIVNNKDLYLPKYLKKDIDKFFNYFYDNYFKSYINKNTNKFNKKAKDINEILRINEVNIIKFIENISGVAFENDIKSIFYYNFNPIQPREFKSDNLLIMTIQPDITAKDILSTPFHEYSHYIFKSFMNDPEFIDLYNSLKNNKKFINSYNNKKNIYTFEEWCEENLVEGFSKYLDYRYYKSAYEYTSFTYDLDFYNYLKNNNFNPKKTSLKDISIQFYKSKLNNN